ncbi:MAG: hypothetical protein QM733_19245 [Ilumatobacteraceae bacterium]
MPGRSPSWPPPAPRRSSCRGRAPPRTIRSQTPTSSATAGAAVLIEQSDLTVDRLVAEIDRLQAHPAALATLAANAHEAGTLIRSGRLLDVVERAAGASPR